MASINIRFTNDDFREAVPDEGNHLAVVHAVRCRTSESGNPLIQVTFHLPEEGPGTDRVIDHFIVTGATPRVVAIGRRRLLSLCRACGIEPAEGQELALNDLVDRELELRIGHETYLGRKRARVRGYRAQP